MICNVFFIIQIKYSPEPWLLSAQQRHRQQQVEVWWGSTDCGEQHLLLLTALAKGITVEQQLLAVCWRWQREQPFKFVAINHIVALDGFHDLGQLKP